MFTSLNVVRIAAVDCDSTRRSAMRARKRDIGTRCSGRAPWVTGAGAGGGPFAAGAGAEGAAGAAFAAGAADAGGALAGAPDGTAAATLARVASASATSPFVIRPPRPVPATLDGSTPCSAIILRAAGSAVTVDAAGGVDAADAGRAGAAVGGGAEAGGDAASAAPAFASVSITAITSFDV